MEVRTFRDELVQSRKYDPAIKTSLASRLAYMRKSEEFARRSVLEYQVGVASLNLSSVEREHKSVTVARDSQWTSHSIYALEKCF